MGCISYESMKECARHRDGVTAGALGVHFQYSFTWLGLGHISQCFLGHYWFLITNQFPHYLAVCRCQFGRVKESFQETNACIVLFLSKRRCAKFPDTVGDNSTRHRQMYLHR